VDETVERILLALPPLHDGPASTRLIDFASRKTLAAPEHHAHRLAVAGRDFPPEGEESLARLLVSACALGWRHVLLFGLRGQRFVGCGLASVHPDVRIDVYGSPGDYLASGLDGGKILVHASCQDQAANIMKSGKLVIAGDVGQAFLYAAKGGEVYVLGSAAGRPLINAVGSPRVVINGTALDYLAESFMAGDPTAGGGFVIVNGMEYDGRGVLQEMPEPYPGGNLFSLASGGAVYIRDPRRKVGADQLNGGRLGEISPLDWAAIAPMLEENEKLFGIPAEALLTVGGKRREPREVYRKVEPASLKALKG
jgi:glutamate synthase domain-containing protein 3